MTGPMPRAHQDQLHYTAVLPVAWTPRATAEDPLLIARRYRRNLAALALDSAGEERRGERPLDDGVAGDLLRVEAKLNAIMELLATLHERDLVLPASVPMRFNAFGIEWMARDAPGADLPIVVRLHLESVPSLPLELPATTLAPPEPDWAAARFEAIKPPLAEAIARMVFREHRRQVADSIGDDK